MQSCWDIGCCNLDLSFVVFGLQMRGCVMQLLLTSLAGSIKAYSSGLAQSSRLLPGAPPAYFALVETHAVYRQMGAGVNAPGWRWYGSVPFIATLWVGTIYLSICSDLCPDITHT